MVGAASLEAIERSSRFGPADVVISNSSGASPASSPKHVNCPLTGFKIDLYSRSARMQGGSESSSLISLLLAMIEAPETGWPSADLASSETSASSPKSDQLSHERLCQEQWWGAIK